MQKKTAEIEADNAEIRKIEEVEIPKIKAKYDADMENVANNDDIQKTIDDLNADKLKVLPTIAEVRLMALAVRSRQG